MSSTITNKAIRPHLQPHTAGVQFGTEVAAERRCTVGKPSCWRTIFSTFLLLAATAVAAPAQTFTIVANLNGTNGLAPEYGPLAQGPRWKPLWDNIRGRERQRWHSLQGDADG